MILEPSTSSGAQTADGVIYAAPAILQSIDLMPPASGVATLKIYDHPSAASGTLLATLEVAAGANSQSIHMTTARRALRGLYADLTGTTTFVVGFSASF